MRDIRKGFILFLLLGTAFCFLECGARILFGHPRAKTTVSKTSGNLDKIEIAVLGSSHSFFGVDASVFSREACNFSSPSQDLYYSYAILEKNAPLLPNLKYIVLSLDYYSFGFDVSKVENYRVSEFQRVGIQPRPLAAPRAPADPDSGRSEPFRYLQPDIKRQGSFIEQWLSNHSIFFRYRTVFARQALRFLQKACLWKKEPARINPGLLVIPYGDRNAPTGATDAKSRAYFHMTTCWNASMEPASSAYLDQLIRLALGKNIKVTLIVMPVTREYFTALTEDFKKHFRDNVSRVTRKYAAVDVKFIEFANDRRFSRADFMDPDHLNAKGAATFTKILDAALEGSP
jgi:hypothetical protein